MVTTGTRVLILKGCNARGITKGTTAKVADVRELGADYGHAVKVSLTWSGGVNAGKTFGFYVRHKNRLTDAVVQMNDGNPMHKIRLQVRKS
jgi:hypothetical protein